MSHPIPSHESDNQYPEDGVTSYKRKHPRPLSKIAERKGKSSQLPNLVQGWKHSMMTPKQKALDKSSRRQERVKEKKAKLRPGSPYHSKAEWKKDQPF